MPRLTPAPAPSGDRRVTVTWTPISPTAPVHYLMGMEERGEGAFGAWVQLGREARVTPFVFELTAAPHVTAFVISPTGDDDTNVYDGARYWWREGDRLDARVDGAPVTWGWHVDPSGNRLIRIPTR